METVPVHKRKYKRYLRSRMVHISTLAAVLYLPQITSALVAFLLSVALIPQHDALVRQILVAVFFFFSFVTYIFLCLSERLRLGWVFIVVTAIINAGLSISIFTLSVIAHAQAPGSSDLAFITGCYIMFGTGAFAVCETILFIILYFAECECTGRMLDS